ncbi:MAG: hypothetical protein ABJC39_11885 [Chloroflexota bacterium]
MRFIRAALAALLVIGLLPAVTFAASARSADGSVALDASTSGIGYDISWPQCNAPYPANPAFGIVGVNAGIVFSANPCLASEVAWAGGAIAGLYANTGNPGPALSKHWPVGQTSPQVCDPANTDTATCAYDYGYNAAADSYADAAAAFTALGLTDSPASSTWWLDVETMNSWRSDVSLNVAALQGATRYLGSVGVISIGFYSTQYQWNVITGGTNAFAGSASWVAGASDAQAASANCAGAGFTGGGVALAQYPVGSFDGNISCTASTPAPDFGLSVGPSSQSVKRGGTATYAVTVAAANGFGGSVALVVSGQPSGATVSVGPNPTTSSSTVTVKTATSGPKGTFTLTIAGTSGALRHTATTKFVVIK